MYVRMTKTDEVTIFTKTEEGQEIVVSTIAGPMSRSIAATFLKAAENDKQASPIELGYYFEIADDEEDASADVRDAWIMGNDRKSENKKEAENEDADEADEDDEDEIFGSVTAIKLD